MLSALPTELADLLARLAANDGAPLLIGAEELGALPAAMADALRGQGAIERASTATGVVCPGCEQACTMPVEVRQTAGREPVAFVACDKRADMGRVHVSLLLLSRWQMTPRTLAQALAGGTGSTPLQPIAAGWRVDQVAGAAGRADVLLSQVRGALQVGVAGHSVPLSDVLVWDGKRLVLDGRTLARLAAAPAGAASESSEDRARRLLRRKAELKQAGVRGFLKQIASEEGRLSVSRIKQIIERAESAMPADGPAHPFAGLGAQTRKTAPGSPPARRKR